MQKISSKIIILLTIACVAAYIGIFIGRVSVDNPFHKDSLTPVENGNSTSERFFININTADANTLMELPGMYQELADEIIKYRNQFGKFISETELMYLEHMTDDIYNQLKGYITLGGTQ